VEDSRTQSCDSPRSTKPVIAPPHTALGRPTVACCSLACSRALSCLQCNMTTVPLAPSVHGCQDCSPCSRSQATSTDLVQCCSIKVPGLSRAGATKGARNQSALRAGTVRELRQHQPRRQTPTPCASRGAQKLRKLAGVASRVQAVSMRPRLGLLLVAFGQQSWQWTCSCSHSAEASHLPSE